MCFKSNSQSMNRRRYGFFGTRYFSHSVRRNDHTRIHNCKADIHIVYTLLYSESKIKQTKMQIQRKHNPHANFI